MPGLLVLLLIAMGYAVWLDTDARFHALVKNVGVSAVVVFVLRWVFLQLEESIRVGRHRRRVEQLERLAARLPRGTIEGAGCYGGGVATVTGELQGYPVELVLRLEARPVVGYELRVRGALLELDVSRPGLVGRLLGRGPTGWAPANPVIVRSLRSLTLEKGIERVTLMGGVLRAHTPLRDRALSLDEVMDVFGCLARIAQVCHDRAAWLRETPPLVIEKSRSGSSRRDASRKNSSPS